MTLLPIQDWIQSDYFKSHNKPNTNTNSLDNTLKIITHNGIIYLQISISIHHLFKI